MLFLSHQFLPLLGEGATVTSVEIDPRSVEASRHNVEVAGLSDRIHFVEGSQIHKGPCNRP